MGVRTVELRAVRTSALPRPLAGNAAYYVLLSIVALVFFFPFFWTIMTSLKQPSELLNFPPNVFPAIPQWHNYAGVYERVPLLRWAGNSVTVTTLATLGEVLTASLAAYAFARFTFRGRDAFFVLSLGTMMLPSQVTLIPQYVLFHKLHWIDTLKPLWVPSWFGGGAFAIFLLRQFMLTLPRELDEAATIDGAGSFRIYWQLLLPLCTPALATLAVIAIMANWGDYFSPLIYLNTQDKFTLAVGLTFFTTVPESSGLPKEHLLMAMSVITTTPLIILFFSAQRYFVQGIALTGLKG
jgi:multiple sugar transport system permease protein